MATSLKIPDVYLTTILQATSGRGDNSNTLAVVGPATGGSFTAVNSYTDPHAALQEIGDGRVYRSMLSAWSNGAKTIKFARVGGTEFFDSAIMDNTVGSAVDVTTYVNREYGSLLDYYSLSTADVSFANQFGVTAGDYFYLASDEKFTSFDLMYGNGPGKIAIDPGRGCIVKGYYWNGVWTLLPDMVSLRMDGNELYYEWDLADVADWQQSSVTVGSSTISGYMVRLQVFNSISLTGTSTALLGNVTLNGTNTLYIDEVAVGDALYDGVTFLGIVASITSNVLLTFECGSAAATAGAVALTAQPNFVIPPNIYIAAKKVGALRPYKVFYQGDDITAFVGNHGWRVAGGTAPGGATIAGIKAKYSAGTTVKLLTADLAIGDEYVNVTTPGNLAVGDAIYNATGSFIGVISLISGDIAYLREPSLAAEVMGGNILLDGLLKTDLWETERVKIILDYTDIQPFSENASVAGTWTTLGATVKPTIGDYVYLSSSSTLSALTFDPYTSIDEDNIIGIVKAVVDDGATLSVTLYNEQAYKPTTTPNQYMYFIRKTAPAMLAMGKEYGASFDITNQILRLGSSGSRIQYAFTIATDTSETVESYYEDPTTTTNMYTGGQLKISVFDTEDLITEVNAYSTYIQLEDLSGTGALPYVSNTLTYIFNPGSNGDYTKLTAEDYQNALDMLLLPNHDDIYFVLPILEDPLSSDSAALHDSVMTATVAHCATSSLGGSSATTSPRIAMTYFNEAYTVGSINTNNNNVQQGTNSNRSYATTSRAVFTIQKAGMPDLISGVLEYSRAYFSAAIAGLIANLEPAIPSTRKQLTISGLDYIYNPSEEIVLIDAGVLTATINRDGVYVVRGINSLVSNSIEREISVRRIIDMSSVNIRESIRDTYIGSVIEGDIVKRIEKTVTQLLLNMKKPAVQGGMIRDFRNIVVTLNPIDPTRVDLYFEIEPLSPLNFIVAKQYVVDSFARVSLSGVQISS